MVKSGTSRQRTSLDGGVPAGIAAIASAATSSVSSWPPPVTRASTGVTAAPAAARRAPQTQQALSQIAARLEKLGFIERRLRNGRGVGLYLTAAGARARAQGHEAVEAFEAGLAEALGGPRHRRLLKSLEEMRTTLGELESAPGVSR